MSCSTKEEVDKLMLLFYINNRELTDQWWDTKNFFFENGADSLSPREMLESDRGTELLEFINRMQNR
jgi:hypothetical protein